eukprot:CAMPEP_0184674452 /NCGR_PEP_ID=MMETSP0308-20130426/87244_1 /TAXON_ID=38269 /ORGANISM="Gloeochaete witrockiana, Strain SAG 46.84" /LENGTH=550 /DNA_ID=CAMNT_0027122053 /DNA_START=493 /DNA_END=2145 /DNA_ORIENTATION=-
MASYRLKRVDFLGREVSIILQNENGPCPLLALSNVLLLRNLIRLHPDMSSVKHETLLGLVGDYVLEVNKIDHINDASIRENHYANMAEVMHSVLPKLIGGLDVNVRFTGPCDFENTSEMAIFELLDVNLYHGWLVDPQDVVLHSMVEPLSYNQLVEKIISADTQGLSPRSLKKTVSLKETLSSQSQRTTSSSALAPTVTPIDDVTTASSSADVTTTSPAISIGCSSESQTFGRTESMSGGFMLQHWLEVSQSQLTHHGLCELHSTVKERELCLFFRNNHFSTLFKFGGLLYLLMTDEGYLRSPVVWEQLEQVNGDNEFTTAEFTIFKASAEAPIAPRVLKNIDHPHMNPDYLRCLEQVQRKDNVALRAKSNQQQPTPPPRDMPQDTNSNSNSNTPATPMLTRAQQHKMKQENLYQSQIKIYRDQQAERPPQERTPSPPRDSPQPAPRDMPRVSNPNSNSNTPFVSWQLKIRQRKQKQLSELEKQREEYRKKKARELEAQERLTPEQQQEQEEREWKQEQQRQQQQKKHDFRMEVYFIGLCLFGYLYFVYL